MSATDMAKVINFAVAGELIQAEFRRVSPELTVMDGRGAGACGNLFQR